MPRFLKALTGTFFVGGAAFGAMGFWAAMGMLLDAHFHTQVFHLLLGVVVGMPNAVVATYGTGKFMNAHGWW